MGSNNNEQEIFDSKNKTDKIINENNTTSYNNTDDDIKNNEEDKNYINNITENNNSYEKNGNYENNFFKSKLENKHLNADPYKRLIKNKTACSLQNSKGLSQRTVIGPKNKLGLRYEDSLYSFYNSKDIFPEIERPKNKLKKINRKKKLNKTKVNQLFDKEGLIIEIDNIKKEIELINIEIYHLQKKKKQFEKRFTNNKKIIEKILGIEENEENDNNNNRNNNIDIISSLNNIEDSEENINKTKNNIYITEINEEEYKNNDNKKNNSKEKNIKNENKIKKEYEIKIWNIKDNVNENNNYYEE